MSPRPGLTPAAYRRITAFALAALAVIIVSGAAVRLTGSGLGCTDWPNCRQGRLVADLDYHPMIEFVNRVFTGVVSVAVILAVLGSRWRTPRRTDLTRWSLGLVAGVIGQIVLGGLVVLFSLPPWLVIGHFALSMVLVWNAVVLHHRAGLPADDSGRAVIGTPTVSARHLVLARAWFALSILVIFTGTIVTGSGPHGGDEKATRLPILFSSAARLHGTTVMAFLALTLLLVQQLRSAGAPSGVQVAIGRVLAVLVVQATIGYVQYFTKVPVVLVGLHIAGATLLWITVVRFGLALRGEAVAPAPARGVLAARS
jgi:heme a synthase